MRTLMDVSYNITRYIVQYVFSYMVIYKKRFYKVKLFICIIQKQKQCEQLYIELHN